MAERQGFEPWEGCPSTVFKTAAIDRSAISPVMEDTITLLGLQMFFLFLIKVDLCETKKYSDIRSLCVNISLYFLVE